MAYPIISLKAGREASTGFHHPWIFSGALQAVPLEVKHGDLVHVADRQGKIIGTGTYSATTSIAVRLFAFTEATIDEAWLASAVKAANDRRRLMGLGDGQPTTGYRVVFGESDNLPGLVIDRYADVLVLQISTAGMDRLRPHIIAACHTIFSPRAIVERSDMAIRREEKLEEITAVPVGEVTEPVQFLENNVKFLADVVGGQKTGFYLDQRELREHIAKLAPGRSILNLFSYTGAASIVALKNGAASVHNIDSSAEALALGEKQRDLNELPAESWTSEEADVFAWLNDHNEPTYDMVILDPPALTKTKSEQEAAGRAYHFLNRAALRLVKSGGILVTSSCSRFFSEDDLAYVLRRASVQTGVTFNVLKTVRQASDHPLSVYFPESAYLKSFIGQVAQAKSSPG